MSSAADASVANESKMKALEEEIAGLKSNSKAADDWMSAANTNIESLVKEKESLEAKLGAMSSAADASVANESKMKALEEEIAHLKAESALLLCLPPKFTQILRRVLI